MPSRVFTVALMVALLTGCGFAQTSSDIPNGVPVTDADIKGRNLLYASTSGDEPLFVYTFPNGKMVGTLSGPIGPRGLCVDRLSDIFAPFVYIVGGVDEFAHGGGSPIAYLGFPVDWENGCSVSPATGALAVVTGPQSLQPVIVVYRNRGRRGWGLEREYTMASMKTSSYCGYDNKGNLFVDGVSSSGAFVLEELVRGSKQFVTVPVSQNIDAPGQVQWDGHHLAIGDTGISPSVVYQFEVSASGAAKVGSTLLSGSTKVEQFWIRGGTLVAPDPSRGCGSTQKGCIALYHYPQGGSAFKTIALAGALGATVSVAR